MEKSLNINFSLFIGRKDKTRTSRMNCKRNYYKYKFRPYWPPAQVLLIIPRKATGLPTIIIGGNNIPNFEFFPRRDPSENALTR